MARPVTALIVSTLVALAALLIPTAQAQQGLDTTPPTQRKPAPAPAEKTTTPARPPASQAAPDAPAVDVAAAPSTVSPPAVPRLFLVVSTDPFQRRVELENAIIRAATHVAPDTRARITVTEIPRSVHDELANLISRDPVGVRPQGGDVLVAPFAGDNLLWEINTGSPDLYLKSAELAFGTDDGKSTVKTYEAAEKTKTDAPLRYYKPGQYLLRLESANPPRSAVLTIKPSVGEARKLTMKWPVSDRFFVIGLENFAADAKRLKDTLMNKNVMGTPFKSVGPVEPTTFVLADLRAVIGNRNVGWNGNMFEVQIPGLRESSTSRIWVLFPLTKEQKDKELAEINKRVQAESSAVVSQMIRQRSVSASNGQPYVMRPETEPKWYELTGGEDKPFAGKWSLESIDQWKEKDRLPECYWLIVYEFGNGTTAFPNPVMKERVVDGVRESAPVYAYDEEVPQWPTGIREMRKQ